MAAMIRRNTYRALQAMAIALCAASSIAFAQTVSGTKPTMSSVLLGVGWGDWALTALVSLAFGLVSLFQRFKREEAGPHWALFAAAHITGALASGVAVYLLVQASFDSPNRFLQALAIGLAGWTGSTGADIMAARFKTTLTKKGPDL